MIRYTTQKPRGFYDDDIAMPSSMTVFEQEDHPSDTGLLDHHGRPLYRLNERLPIGFHR